MLKNTNVTSKEGGVEETDNYLSVAIATGNDIGQIIESIEEIIQSACKRTFRQTNSYNNNSKRN